MQFFFMTVQGEYPIREYPECWRLLPISSKFLHLGMTCENYQFSRKLNFLFWHHNYGGYQDEIEEDKE